MSIIYYARASANNVAEAMGMNEDTRKQVPEQVFHFASLDGESFLPVNRRPSPEDYADIRRLFEEETGQKISPMRWGKPIVERAAGSIEVIAESGTT